MSADHAIGRMLAAGADRHVLERIEALIMRRWRRSSRRIECELTSFVHTLPSTCDWRGITMDCCAVSRVHARRQREYAERLGSRVEPREPALEHQGEPPIAVVVGLERQRAGRESSAWQRIGEFRMGAGARIEPPDIGLDEVRVPDEAVRIGAHVVRRDGLARQVVFGDDDMRRAAGRARQCLERIVPRSRCAQIDRGEIFADPAGAIVRHLALDQRAPGYAPSWSCWRNSPCA